MMHDIIDLVLGNNKQYNNIQTYGVQIRYTWKYTKLQLSERE